MFSKNLNQASMSPLLVARTFSPAQRGCNNAGMSEPSSSGLDRRGFLGVCSMVGLGQTLLPGALFTLATQAKAQSSPIVSGGEVKASTDGMAKITPEMIEAAAAIAEIIAKDGPQ